MNETSKKILDIITEKGISYGELSEKTKIPKSALQRYATGQTEKIPVDRLKLIAVAIGTTPEYLMGWDDAEHNKNASPTELPLSEGEKRLLELFNRVPEDKQQLVLQMIRAALESL